LDSAGLDYFCQSVFRALAPFCGRHVPPTHLTRSDIFMIVLHHAKKLFIGRQDGAIDISGHDPQNVGIHQAPYPRFTIGPRTATEPARRVEDS
jgi:hypothetical protein